MDNDVEITEFKCPECEAISLGFKMPSENLRKFNKIKNWANASMGVRGVGS